MTDEPARGSQSAEASLTQTERRDLIKLTLELARWESETYGRFPTVQDVERHIEGQRPT